MARHKFSELSQLGLSDKEIAVYSALLGLGRSSVLDTSKMAEVERTTTYRILETLHQRGLVETVKEGKRIKWVAKDPKSLLDLVDETRKTVRALLPELSSLYEKQEGKPKLIFLEGENVIRKAFREAILKGKEGGTILAFSPESALYPLFSGKGWPEIVQLRVKKKILSRILIPSVSQAPGYRVGIDKKNLREIKLVERKLYPFKATVSVFDRMVMLITTRKKSLAVMIEDEEIADTMRMIFELAWRATK